MGEYSRESFERAQEKQERANKELEEREDLYRNWESKYGYMLSQMMGMFHEGHQFLKFQDKDALALLIKKLESDQQLQDLLTQAHEEALKMNEALQKLEDKLEGSNQSQTEQKEDAQKA